MATSWLRLWHEMPNDPKWRTIARVSGQPLSLVQAMFVHLLVDASRNVTRGHITVAAEDLASALDATEEQINSVFSAMQGRVLDGQCLSGWSRRQPIREDLGNPETGAKCASERKKEQRERDKKVQLAAASLVVTPCHEESQQIRLDSDKDNKKPNPLSPPSPETPPSETLHDPPLAKPKRRARLPNPFNLTPAMREWAVERAPAVNLALETERFVNYYRGNGKTMADWCATWRNWMLKAQDGLDRRATGPPANRHTSPDFNDISWAEEPIL